MHKGLKKAKNFKISKLIDSKSGVMKSKIVLFGHENWNLVINMMIGIRMAVKTVSIQY